MDRERLAEIAAALLEQLGDEVDVVAHQLESAGVRGRRKSPCDCPVAHYLVDRLKSGRVPAVVVRRWDVEILQSGPGGKLEPETGPLVDLPWAVKDFIACFDAGQFPQLELEPV